MARVVRRVKQKNTEIADVLGLIDMAKLEEVKQETIQTLSVEDVLRKYKGYVVKMTNLSKIEKFFDQAIVNGIISIDTETNNSVEARTAITVGVCLYTPFRRPVYIPCAHRDKLTGELVPGQVSFSFLKEQFQRIKDAQVKTVWHNAKFDVNVIDTNCGIRLPAYWDTMVAAKLLDENIKSARLKDLYRLLIEPAQPTYGITKLFEANETADIDKFTLYSAVDPFDTYKLYEYQKKILEYPSMSKVLDLFLNIEMRICEISCEMEQEGAHIDEKLCKNYLEYWKNLADGYQEKILKFFSPVKSKVEEWPINIVSTDQVRDAFAAMNIHVDDTTSESLTALSKDIPIANDIVEYRSANHMVTSFFGPLLEQINPKTGRIHASFNQLGTEDKTIKTGRFSCVQPNLQQLPSFDDSVRLCFNGGVTGEIVESDRIKLYYLDLIQTEDGELQAKALCTSLHRIMDINGDLYSIEDIEASSPILTIKLNKSSSFKIVRSNIIMGADYSQQEPRYLASVSNEHHLIEGYNLRTPEFPKGKDYYAQLASGAFNRDYWTCTEFKKPTKVDSLLTDVPQEYFLELDSGDMVEASKAKVGMIVSTGHDYSQITSIAKNGKILTILTESGDKVKASDYLPGEYSAEGKAYRSKAKGIQLGLSYGMGSNRLAGILGVDHDEAKSILTSFFATYRDMATWREFNDAKLRTYGFMETLCGRRRRLPDVFLPPVKVIVNDRVAVENIFPLQYRNFIELENPKESERETKSLEKVGYKKKEDAKKALIGLGYKVYDNGAFIARTNTQCTNAVIQGGAADMTKLAMIKIYNNETLKRCKAKLRFLIHDEVLIECPAVYREEVEEEFIDCMLTAPASICKVKMSCDAEIETRWKLGHMCWSIKKLYQKEGAEAVYEKYSPFRKEDLDRIMIGEFDPSEDVVSAR